MKRIGFALLFILAHSVVVGQSTSGNLEGWVFDTAGTAIPGASISVSSPDLQGIRGVSTDEQGFFRLLALPSGNYKVKVQHISYQPVAFEDVQIRLGKTTALPDVKLRQTSIEMAEVVISGQRPILDPSTATSGADLPHETFELLPVDRNYRSIASMVPHSNQSYYGDEVNIGGATGNENRFFVNGNDVTDMSDGVGGTNLPYNFIREIEVKTGGYEPEYKSSLGGIINVITYSGGNNFSGQVFSFFTSSNFSGDQRLAPSEPPKGSFALYDFGVSIGGPIEKDKLWFFAALNPSYRDEDIRIPGLGNYPDRLRSQNFAAKLTWKASDVLDINATVLGDPSTNKAVNRGSSPAILSATNADLFLEDISSGGYNAVIDARHVASKNVILQSSLSWTTRKQKIVPSTERGAKEVNYSDGLTGTVSGGTGDLSDVTASIVGGKFGGTAMFGEHAAKAGIEYREIVQDKLFDHVRLYKNDDTSFTLGRNYNNGTVRFHVPSVFIQDSWSMNKYLTISGGIRWDGLFIIASNGELATRVLRQFQPRFGVVFMPGGDESQKVFASFGRYAEDLMLSGSGIYHLAGSYVLGLNYNHDPRINPAGADTAWNISSTVRPGVQDLYGQYYDEFTLGYERLLAQDFKLTLRGTYRTLKEVVDDGEAPAGSNEWYYGNPGEGALSAYPRPQREYLALEVSLEKSWGSTFNILASYVLSRNYGNFTGLFYQELGLAIPNAGGQFDFLDLYNKNATGLLPNDRTHIFKVNASYRLDVGLTCAASFLWETGTPLSEYAGTRGAGATWITNLVQRGSAGRLPSLWDLDLRLAYNLPFWNDRGPRPRLIIDLFHIGSQRQVVMQDQLHYLSTDNGNPIDPNATYGMAQKFQPPMSVRLGVEVNF